MNCPYCDHHYETKPVFNYTESEIGICEECGEICRFDEDGRPYKPKEDELTPFKKDKKWKIVLSAQKTIKENRNLQ